MQYIRNSINLLRPRRIRVRLVVMVQKMPIHIWA